ncbi:hypothetical protein [Cardinium endosymbiont of Bemisia tabaci]|uniref:hypothetical protein n=1 Tax=Cardinium endosymbiont of Bemisia tabaci TaxID=672794 RepID=UPI000442D17F|nr:hypothetical protein [Cardinium endosymbiont of Bemisia tabaci]CDG49582.1 Ankyrin repeats-containing protein [Cardinium endosymbiont cBtQ1 of Bemisia tabaci]
MPQKIKKELIERLLTDPDISFTSQGNYVEVPNRSNPEGFSQSLALLLSEIPVIHSAQKPEFLVHFFLGAALTLPYTKLMAELDVQDIYFKLDNPKDSKWLKLVFSIRENINGKDNYKAKFIIINRGDQSDNIRFTNEEIKEIYRLLSTNGDWNGDTKNQYGHILYIDKPKYKTDKGFKLSILPEEGIQRFNPQSFQGSSSSEPTFTKVKKHFDESDFGENLDKLSSSDVKNVKKGTEGIFKLLGNIYTHKDYTKVLGQSEAAYHGFIYGFFRSNAKYKYALDCYVERIAGKGYADLILLSRKSDEAADDKNIPSNKEKRSIPIIVEIKSGGGADQAIEQINQVGYIYNLPNIRTNAEDAVIVGVDFNKNDKNDKTADHSNDQKISDVKVETRCIDTFERSLIADLVVDIKDNKSNDEIKTNIKKNIKHLYYSSIKSTEHHFLRNVLLGEVITLNADLVDTSHVFTYTSQFINDKVTTIILKQKGRKAGIILNIIESNGEPNTRSKSTYQAEGTTFDQNKIVPVDTKLGIENVCVVTMRACK